MGLLSAILLVLVIIPAVSYGWGMRGTTIGGEKGAMLPGAIIGLCFAAFSDVLIVRENFYVFAAFGAVSMYFGGSMTYGETLGLSKNQKPAENMKKGLIALFIKGFLWFGSFGTIFTTGINAVGCVYTFNELIVLFAITPVVAVGLYFLLNKPLKPQENKFPKIYFSKTRQESWGALLGVFLTLLIFAIIKNNWFTVIFSVCCALFGGFGWVLGQLLQIYSIHYADNSPSYFGRILGKSNNNDSWKIMECVFGAFGGLGAAIGFIITYDSFKSTMFKVEQNGGLIPVNNTFLKITFISWVVLVIVDLIHYFIKEPVTKKDLKNKLKTNEITRAQYSTALLKAVDSVPKRYGIYFKVTDVVEPVIYAAIPFVLISFGSENTAKITSFFLLLFVLLQEISLEKFVKGKKSTAIIITSIVLSVLIFVLQLIVPEIFTLNITLILYTIIYEFLTLVYLVPRLLKEENSHNDTEKFKEKLKNYIKTIKKNKTFLKVHSYFVICIILVLLIIV